MTSETPASADLSSQMLKDLQSWWEIPSIAQYISLFRESFNLPEIEIEELEKGLVDDSIKGPNSWLQELLLCLLRSLLPSRVNKDNCEIQLQKLIARKWPGDKENPYPEGKSFSELTLRSKVEIIYSLCVYRLDRNDITEVMKSMDADALRVQKLGIDDIGNTYWYFYGTRLYMEENLKDEKSWDEEWKKQKKQSFKKRGRGRPRKIRCTMKSDGESEDFEDVDAKNNEYMNVNSKSQWSVVCDTIEEWVMFAEKFKASKSKNEKALFQIVQENFLPTLNKIYEEKEKKLQQKIRDLMPIREKVVTRRETRKLRGDAFESPVINGYSDEAHKLHMVKDRARRLEERNKRASETKYSEIGQHKKPKHSEKFDDSSLSFDSEPSRDSDEYNYDLTPKIHGLKMDLQSQMERLISSVKLHKDAWPFLYPVSEDDAPGYYEIIKDPIDLSTIESRLHKGAYETVGELDEEFSQMVSNCELYNGENHGYSKMVQTLWRMFRRGVSKILDSLPPEENLNSVSEESSTNSDCTEFVLKSPHIRKFKKDKDVKRKEKKKKKKQGTVALEILAQASELAVKENASQSSPPQKKSPVPQQFQTVPHTLPSKSLPYSSPSTTSSIIKTSLPVTSSNFIPVSSFNVNRTKPTIIRTKAPQPVEIQNVTTSFNTCSNPNESYNTISQNNNVFQTMSSKTVPLVYSGYGQPSPSDQDLRFSNNQGAMAVQSNICMSNGVPIVQQVLIPTGQQQIQVQSGGQFVFASPQNNVNRLLNNNPKQSIQNNVRQLNHSFTKVVPQIMTQTPMMQGLQLQAVSQNGPQAYTQVAQNPQFVNIPATYMITNQNQISASSPQTLMNMQQYQLSQRPQMQINGQRNG